MYSPSNTDTRSLSTTTAIIINQFKLNFLSMPYLSIFCMLFPQQTSTTQVRTAREINTKMEGFFMREIKNTKIIAVDHGYGNIKTANTVTPTGITAHETEPISPGTFWNITAPITGSAKDTRNLSRTKRWMKTIIS